jgi:hypothetical protein
VLVESPSRLEENIAQAQKYVDNTVDEGKVRIWSFNMLSSFASNPISFTVESTEPSAI